MSWKSIWICVCLCGLFYYYYSFSIDLHYKVCIWEYESTLTLFVCFLNYNPVWKQRKFHYLLWIVNKRKLPEKKNTKSSYQGIFICLWSWGFLFTCVFCIVLISTKDKPNKNTADIRKLCGFVFSPLSDILLPNIKKWNPRSQIRLHFLFKLHEIWINDIH